MGVDLCSTEAPIQDVFLEDSRQGWKFTNQLKNSGKPKFITAEKQ